MKIDKSWYIKPIDPNFRIRYGAGGVIIRQDEGGVLVGLVRGSGFDDYIFPKGGVEKNETFLETAVREIGEETGLIDLKLLADFGFKERLTYKKDYWSKMNYFLFLTKQITGKATDPHENYIIEWFDINKLPSMFWPEQKDLIEENREKIKRLLF